MHPTKLFAVEITYKVMVAAANEREAEAIAESERREIASNEQPEIICTGLILEVDSTWKGCIPYGDADDMPCEHFTGQL
jgi:hypothetical protein